MSNHTWEKILISFAALVIGLGGGFLLGDYVASRFWLNKIHHHPEDIELIRKTLIQTYEAEIEKLRAEMTEEKNLQKRKELILKRN